MWFILFNLVLFITVKCKYFWELFYFLKENILTSMVSIFFFFLKQWDNNTSYFLKENILS